MLWSRGHREEMTNDNGSSVFSRVPAQRHHALVVSTAAKAFFMSGQGRA
jgi:hypothetical protein